MIVLENVYYSYGETIALKNVNIDFDGGITIVVGPNGSGKTTLLKVASAIFKPSKGRVLIDGVDPWLSKDSWRATRKHIVYVHEKPIIFRGTVLENLVMPLVFRGWSRDDAREEAIRLLKQFGLERLAQKKRNQLSAGQKQMVSILRALILKPKYLLLDEPTNTLDINNRKRLMDYLKALKETTIIIATHDLFLPIELNSKIVALESGRIVEMMDSKDFVARYLGRD